MRAYNESATRLARYFSSLDVVATHQMKYATIAASPPKSTFPISHHPSLLSSALLLRCCRPSPTTTLIPVLLHLRSPQSNVRSQRKRPLVDLLLTEVWIVEGREGTTGLMESWVESYEMARRVVRLVRERNQAQEGEWVEPPCEERKLIEWR